MLDQLAIVRKHAYADWVDTNGDRKALIRGIWETAERIHAEAGISIWTVWMIVQVLWWVYLKWFASPPKEHDETEVKWIGRMLEREAAKQVANEIVARSN